MEISTGKGVIYFLSVVVAVSFIGAMIASAYAPFFIFLLLVHGVWLLKRVFEYRDILLSGDSMHIRNIYGNELTSIPYNDIKQVGFLNAAQGQSEILVIIERSNNELQLSTLQYDDLDKVCSFLEEKIGQY